jgi:hypothetical protein
VFVFWYKKALKFYCSQVHSPLKKSKFGLMLNCIGFLHATRKGFNFDVDFVIHGAKQAFNFDVNDGGGCFVAVWRKEPHSVLFPSRHAPRKIRICEEQGSKGRLDSSPCQVVLAQYPWGLKSHDPFA